MSSRMHHVAAYDNSGLSLPRRGFDGWDNLRRGHLHPVVARLTGQLLQLHPSDRSRTHQGFQFRLQRLFPQSNVPLDLR